MSKTSLVLSNLRGFVILLVVAFHSAVAYLGSQPASRPAFDNPPFDWRAIPIVDAERWFGFDLFCASQYVYLMQLMFFLSGLFVWPSLMRKGAWTFLHDRLLRLGVPFTLGVSLLMPVAHYPVYRVSAVDPSWSAFWAQWTALPFWPSGPLWFLWFLLVLDAAAAALGRFAPRAGEALGRWSASAGGEPVRYLLALLAISGLAYLPLAAFFKPWEWVDFGPFGFQPSFTLLYVVYFFAGVGVGALGIERGLLEPDGGLARRWVVWAAAALGGFLLWIIPTALSLEGQGVSAAIFAFVADLGLVAAGATACFALLAVFLRFATARRRLFDSLSENAYGIYLVHYLFVVWLQYLLLGIALPAVAKAAVVFAGAVLLSWGATAAMCRIPIGARLIRAERRALARAP